MRLLYEASDVVEATLLQLALENAGMDILLFNRYSQGASGMLPVNQTGPQIWLNSEQQWQEAKRIVRDFESRQGNPDIIFCPVCREQNPANFTICWNCNHNLLE